MNMLLAPAHAMTDQRIIRVWTVEHIDLFGIPKYSPDSAACIVDAKLVIVMPHLQKIPTSLTRI